MFKLHIVRLLVFVAILSIIATWFPVRAQAQGSQSLSNGLQESVRAALGQNYRPMQFPTTQQAKLLASDRAASDNFGYSVALSNDGDIALVGTPTKSENGLTKSGAAYIFIRVGNVWTQQQKLLANDAANFNHFGWSVALSSNGSTALIGAYTKSNTGRERDGTVYVFIRSGNSWMQQEKLAANDRENDEKFGWSVALSDDGYTALIGAVTESAETYVWNGAAYVFIRTGNIWTQQYKLLADDRASNDGFGYSVSLSGDGSSALVGSVGTSSPNAPDSGAVYFFTRTGVDWTQQQKLWALDRATGDSFGRSVTVSGDGFTALIGAPAKSDNGLRANGAAYTFTRSGNLWTEQQKLLANDKADYDEFGRSVALSHNGSIGLVGAAYSDNGSISTGSVYVFARSGTTWTQQYELLAGDRASSDLLGESTALSAEGNIAIAGAYNKSVDGLTESGAAYIFASTLSTPTPTNTPIPPRPDTIGVYNSGVFSLRNTNNAGGADIVAAFGGAASDLPIVGDWNSDGVDTIGVYRSATGFFLLSDSNTSPAVNYTVLFGNPGDTPFAGKWTPDMTGSGIGVYRNSNGILYQKKQLVTGFDDFFAVFGNPGDQGVAGDWDGNGFDSIGIYRASSQTWYLTNNSTPSGITFSDIDFVWNIGSNLPVVGDWDGDGDSTVGYLTASGVFTLHPNNAAAGSDNTFAFGAANSRPIAGKWTSGSSPSPRGVVAPITGAQPGGDNRNSGDGD
jgi:hypothetical protein